MKNVGFLSTRIKGTDGVSLEIEKWAEVLERNGYEIFYFAGLCDRDPGRSYIVEEAFFDHPDIKRINESIVGKWRRTSDVSKKVSNLKFYLKEKIYDFIKKFHIDLLIVENALAIPMNIPLGLAITEFIAESCFPTIAHHHDFYWERERFLINSAKDYIDRAFPPDLKSIKHVVINSIASEQLSFRKGISNVVIPNVCDFKNPPEEVDEGKKRELRKFVGLEDDDYFILQPTRIVPRKWIEKAIDIVYMMNLKNPTLVISHEGGDEGDIYVKRILNYGEKFGVRIKLISDVVGWGRENGKPYTISDVYGCADLVTYPSGYEGFGNAFLETLYYKKPIVVNRYSIYIADIEPKGFEVISFDGMVSEDVIEKVYKVLEDEQYRKNMVELNYNLAKKYFSLETLEKKLLPLIEDFDLSFCGR